MTQETFMIVTGVVTFLTTAANAIFSQWKAKRERQWQMDDRRLATAEIIERAKAEAEALRIKTEATSEALAAETRAIAYRLEQTVRKSHTRLREKQDKIVADIAENTKVNVEALKEANSVNQKIATIGEMSLQDGRRTADIITATLKTIAEVPKKDGV